MPQRVGTTKRTPPRPLQSRRGRAYAAGLVWLGRAGETCPRNMDSEVDLGKWLSQMSYHDFRWDPFACWTVDTFSVWFFIYR